MNRLTIIIFLLLFCAKAEAGIVETAIVASALGSSSNGESFSKPNTCLVLIPDRRGNEMIVDYYSIINIEWDRINRCSTIYLYNKSSIDSSWTPGELIRAIDNKCNLRSNQ